MQSAHKQALTVFSWRILERLTKSKGFLNVCFRTNGSRFNFHVILAPAEIQRVRNLSDNMLNEKWLWLEVNLFQGEIQFSWCAPALFGILV